MEHNGEKKLALLLEYVEQTDLFSEDLLVQIDPDTHVCQNISKLPFDEEVDPIWASLHEAESLCSHQEASNLKLKRIASTEVSDLAPKSTALSEVKSPPAKKARTHTTQSEELFPASHLETAHEEDVPLSTADRTLTEIIEHSPPLANPALPPASSSMPQKEYQPQKNLPPTPSPSPLTSPLLCPEHWPPHAAARAHVLLPLHPPSSPIAPRCRVVYLPIVTHRSSDNLALHMSLWISRRLGLPLDILAFVEEQQYNDFSLFSRGNNVHCSPLAAMRKVVARVSSLIGFRDALESDWRLHLEVCTHSPSVLMAQTLYEIYGPRPSPSATSAAFSRESRIDDENDARGSALVVVMDDVFHPALMDMVDSFKRSVKEIGLNVQFMVALDSDSIVPFRSLMERLVREDDSTAPSVLRSAFDGALSEDAWGAAESFAVALKNTHVHPEVGEDDCLSSKHRWASLPAATAGAALKWADIESNLLAITSQLSRRMEGAVVKISLPQHGSRQALTLLQSLLSAGAGSEEGEAIVSCLLDMSSAWNVISPFRIVKAVCRHQLWKLRFQEFFCHGDMCRHKLMRTFLAAGGQEKSRCGEQPQWAVDLLGLLSHRASQKLSSAVHQHHQLSHSSAGAGSSGSSSWSCKEMIACRSPDDVFNNIQKALQLTGLFPDTRNRRAHYWFLSFLRYVRVDVPSLLRIVLLEMARNCVHVLEYSLWPLVYLIGVIEDVCELLFIADAEAECDGHSLVEAVALQLQHAMAAS